MVLGLGKGQEESKRNGKQNATAKQKKAVKKSKA
jgi:hypothetical protein